jgi:hypothetical protein
MSSAEHREERSGGDEKGRAERGRRESGKAHADAPYRIGQALNPGGQTPRLRL